MNKQGRAIDICNQALLELELELAKKAGMIAVTRNLSPENHLKNH
ncbi:hypothetical protein [Nitrosomonas sp.]|nr:hypothetical protein [Nitrosomonas sp.]